MVMNLELNYKAIHYLVQDNMITSTIHCLDDKSLKDKRKSSGFGPRVLRIWPYPLSAV